MSYRSFKRVLGETSLERKCRFLFGACLLLLITGSFWLYGKRTEDLVYKQNRNNGRLVVDTIMMIAHWQKLTTGEDEKPFVVDISESLRNQEYTWRAIRPTALRPSDPADPSGLPADRWESELLRHFDRHPPPEPADRDFPVSYAERFTRDAAVYQYYQPVYVPSPSCVSCHRTIDGSTDLVEGDLLRVIQVNIPAGPVREDLAKNRAILLSTAIVTVFLAMIAAYVIVRYVIVKPLKHLRDVSDAISHGDIEQRAEIRTGDEFEELGSAFNRMLRHLVTTQDELKQANATLDTKVDELAQVNMRLFELNRLKSDFLATMSHELRTPLNSILGFSDVLSTSPSLEDKQRRYVGNIAKSGRMLLDMINDILDLAKIESGKMDVRLGEFRLEQVVNEQCDLARPLSEKKNIDLEIQFQGGLPPLYQDQGKVQQILNNLLSNAIKFTPEGGRIMVAARQMRDGRMELTVADTGVGIAEEDQVRIFEKFRQGHTVLPDGDAMTREYSGTGLGLSIVKELCRLLGGTISLESELGKGSTFTVRLPWSLERTRPEPGAEPFNEPESTRQGEPDRRGERLATQPLGE